MVKEYTNEKIEDIKELTVLDFYADWCGPCKMLSKVLETLDVNILKINVDEHEDMAKEYRVMSIPNLFFVKDGEIKHQIIGFHSKEDLESIIEELK